MTEKAIRRHRRRSAVALADYGLRSSSIASASSEPTDQIVLVAVASAHRGDAFAACEFIMDYLKTHAPFWKKEAGKGWVEAQATDDAAAERWQDPSRKTG